MPVTEMDEREIRAHYAANIACIGDTDGDGNCPLQGCMHCRPDNFTLEQLYEVMVSQFPHRALLVLLPAHDENGYEHGPSGQISLWRTSPTEPRSEHLLVPFTLTPLKDKAALRNQVSVLFDAYVKNCAARGVKLPEHEVPPVEKYTRLYDYRFVVGTPGETLDSMEKGDWSNCEDMTREQIHARIDEVLDQLDAHTE